MATPGTTLSLRAAAGLWFAGFALLGSAGLYLSAVADRDALTMTLYLGYPTVSAFFAAMLLAHRVLGASSSIRAAFGGLGIFALAFLIFAALYVVTLAQIGHVQNRAAFLGAVLTLGLVMTAPVLLPLAAVAGCLLHVIRRRAVRSVDSSASG